ncbi:thioesterase family protein [Rubrobacter aplysinae]|uniref:thioesterase family protein n=1 Tax=Rubrobacter aplysinae TaxID=909625 RepID=UPI00064C4350|nr:thioesterase family protein [Rubrobacter aplysinae]
MPEPENTGLPYNAPLRLHEAEVLPEWVDYNGHMSEAFYVLVFGHSTDALLNYIGMDAEYRERSRCSLYTLEAHVSYVREAREAEPLHVTTQLLDHDHKRAHLFHSMYHATDRRLLATGEVMMLNVDNTEPAGPRSAPFSEEISSTLKGIKASHDSLPLPEQAGRAIGIERR